MSQYTFLIFKNRCNLSVLFLSLTVGKRPYLIHRLIVSLMVLPIYFTKLYSSKSTVEDKLLFSKAMKVVFALTRGNNVTKFSVRSQVKGK